jgi:hypothetical protein
VKQISRPGSQDGGVGSEEVRSRYATIVSCFDPLSETQTNFVLNSR